MRAEDAQEVNASKPLAFIYINAQAAKVRRAAA